mmetsp:Transcript_23828/g.66563  ORF Transcript_23828/g.66563 Transcript_23828/m.66563 type:complete len:104 (-) Transcript_23828:133-444(-)
MSMHMLSRLKHSSSFSLLTFMQVAQLYSTQLVSGCMRISSHHDGCACAMEEGRKEHTYRQRSTVNAQPMDRWKGLRSFHGQGSTSAREKIQDGTTKGNVNMAV